MKTMATPAQAGNRAGGHSRWWQVVIGVGQRPAPCTPPASVMLLSGSPDRRGLPVGLISAGFGAGSALTVVPIARMIEATGYQSAFFSFGLMQGAVIIVLSFFLVAPPLELLTAGGKKGKLVRRQYRPTEVLGQPVFWLLYVISTVVLAGGLIAVAQLGPIARDYHVDKIPVSLLGITLPALTFALTLDRIMNGLCRPFLGWVSDNIGRELKPLRARLDSESMPEADGVLNPAPAARQA